MTRIASTIAASVVAFLAGCTVPADAPDNAAALADIGAHRGGQEVVVRGIVTQVYPSVRSDAGVHERFSVRVGAAPSDQEIQVADNITVGSPAPVRSGDEVTVKGVLEIDPAGPVIHWTHHDPRFRHPGGFVMLNGKKYD